jgi:hypothetical protein
MSNGYRTPDTAELTAQRIYDSSTECLMAHSIRAVERHLREVFQFNTQIVLTPCPDVFTDMGRLSWSSVASNSGHLTFIRYWDNKDLDKNHKRFCIAHELYHIIWSIATAADVPRTPEVEKMCDHFANELCRHHDKFYADQAKINNGDIRFQGLPFRSA